MRTGRFVGVSALRAQLDWPRVSKDYISGYEGVLKRRRSDEAVRVLSE
jgi:hypothetical protein